MEVANDARNCAHHQDRRTPRPGHRTPGPVAGAGRLPGRLGAPELAQPGDVLHPVARRPLLRHAGDGGVDRRRDLAQPDTRPAAGAVHPARLPGNPGGAHPLCHRRRPGPAVARAPGHRGLAGCPGQPHPPAAGLQPLPHPRHRGPERPGQSFSQPRRSPGPDPGGAVRRRTDDRAGSVLPHLRLRLRPAGANGTLYSNAVRQPRARPGGDAGGHHPGQLPANHRADHRPLALHALRGEASGPRGRHPARGRCSMAARRDAGLPHIFNCWCRGRHDCRRRG